MARAARQPSVRMLDCARQLLAYEAALHKASANGVSLVSRVLDALQPPLVTLAGLNSWCVLLVRALALATARAPGLTPVKVRDDGELVGYPPGRQEERETGIALIAHLLGLLASFIGEGAMLRILAGIWPGVTISDSELSGENADAPRR